jgi:hypothetical protein
MKINGLEIPAVLLRAFETKKFQFKVGSLHLKEDKDSFGNKLETEIGQIYREKPQIQKETDNLSAGFELNGVYGEESDYCNEPGFIADIVDFRHVVVFAISSDGSPFCLDYRRDIQSPSVIWWDDVYWRKISDNVDSFLSLFQS